MITVDYILTPYYGEWRSVAGRGTELEFRVGEEINGIINFAGRRIEIQNGRGRVNTAGLSHGEYTPYLLTELGEIELEPLVLSHERVTPAPTKDKVHRTGLSRIRALEKETKENKERIDELYTLIKGTALFG
jgi:hypothetical protein